jgi:hypothetical protein
MRKHFARAGWMLLGVAALYAVSAMAGAVNAGPLDPPGPVASTMRTIESIPPSWFRELAANNGDGGGCNSTRFTCVMGNQAVLDNETGLVWERDAGTNNPTFNGAWQECAQYVLIDNRRGWRLPTIDELATLIDKSQSPFRLPAGHPFTNVNGVGDGPYWSSTTDPTAPSTGSFAVDFLTGDVVQWSKGGTPPSIIEHVWCVRGPGGNDGY